MVSSVSTVGKSPRGIAAHVWAALAAFFIFLVALIRSIAFRSFKKTSDSDPSCDIMEQTFEPAIKKELRPPSSAPCLKEADLSSVLKRLGELEKKVDVLQTKSIGMPYEKEELLNAAVYRVDALEAELIATKKVIPALLAVTWISIFDSFLVS